MEFFLPGTKTEKLIESNYKIIKDFNNSNENITERRIYEICYSHGGQYYKAQVGKCEIRTGELIIAIFESGSLFYICTPSRGVFKGSPILVGEREVSYIEDFD